MNDDRGGYEAGYCDGGYDEHKKMKKMREQMKLDLALLVRDAVSCADHHTAEQLAEDLILKWEKIGRD